MELIFEYAETSVENILKAAKTTEVNGMVSMAMLEGMYHEMQRLHKEKLKSK